MNEGIISHNGTRIIVTDMKELGKRPSLVVSFDDDATIYKVASFQSKEKAQWFIDVLKEFY